jgi:sepiapterin reductase
MLLLVVSGASKGFGQAVSVAFASHFRSIPMRIILTARSESGLMETMQMIEQEQADEKKIQNVSIHPLDLGQLDTLESNLNLLVDAAQPLDRYEHVVIINNAGSVGPLGPTASVTSLAELSNAIQLNVTSSLWFSNVWARVLQDHPHTTIVNISSLCAIQPFPTMATYCAGKAARDMFHVTLAKENPKLQVLNYAPGAMETSMTEILKESTVLSDDLSKWFHTSELIDPMTSAKKLLSLVDSQKFTSGSHVDYWDT